MLCDNIPTAKPLYLCVDDDARVYLGESLLSNLKARLTNMATGRVIELPVQRAGADVYLDGLPELVMGHVYLVELTYNAIPVAFYPYQLTGTNFVATSTGYMGVYVTFDVLVDGDGDTYIGPDGWLTI